MHLLLRYMDTFRRNLNCILLRYTNRRIYVFRLNRIKNFQSTAYYLHHIGNVALHEIVRKRMAIDGFFQVCLLLQYA